MKKVIILFVTIGLLLAGCSASENPEEVQKDEIVISVGTVILKGGYDPIAGYGVWGPDIFHSTLLKFNLESKLENDLVTDYDVSPDGLTYTYHLREDAKFTDGESLTAEDVVFTYMQAKESGSPADLTMLEEAKATDEYTVVFTLNKPWSPFLTTTATIGIVPEHAYSEQYGEFPIGSGPWEVVEFQKEQQLILVPNEHYFGEKPLLNKVTFMSIDEDSALAVAKSGDLDLVLVNSEFAKEEIHGMNIANIETMSGLVINFPMVEENTTADGVDIGNNVTKDLAIRKALNIGIDRQQIIDNALDGIGDPTFGWTADLPWGNEEAYFTDNRLEEAKSILEDAGWVDTDGDGIREKDGLKAEFTITGRSDDSQRYNTVVALEQEAKKLGIDITTQSAPWSECRVAQATPTCWVFGSHNPMDVYRYYHSSQMGVGVIGNPSSYSNPKVDEYIDRALVASTEEEANENWRLSQWDGDTGMKEDYPYLWIVNVRNSYFIKDGLDIGEQRINVKNQGISVIQNLDKWSWK
ncbi:ABC transporter substrate-binding protein [Alkalibacterium gilvum]|uniref:ABC transporter substrate-binding protein n=1 Tax=Alkalibacterium gilvum TaxID=1130080 RepID=UPI003F930085